MQGQENGDRNMLEEFFPYRLAITASAFSQLLVDVYQRRFGLGRDEWRLLYLLANVEVESSLDLGRNTSLDKVQVSRAAERLLKKGLIERATSSVNRRLWLYACTPSGRAMFDEVRTLVEERSEAVLQNMTRQDREAIERGLAALRAATDRVARSL
jgi:DNA-binding MarR family transcriptional regulator